MMVWDEIVQLLSKKLQTNSAVCPPPAIKKNQKLGLAPEDFLNLWHVFCSAPEKCHENAKKMNQKCAIVETMRHT